MNNLASSLNDPSCVLDVMDCIKHMLMVVKGCLFYSKNILPLCLPLWKDQYKDWINVVVFDGAANVQKAIYLLKDHFLAITVMQWVEHSIATIIGRWMGLHPIKDICQFAKKVSMEFLYVSLKCNLTPSLSMDKLHNIFDNSCHAPLCSLLKGALQWKEVGVHQAIRWGVRYSVAEGSMSKGCFDRIFCNKAFRDLKKFAFVGEVLLHEGLWNLLWYVWKANPMYCLLIIADMKIGGIDKAKYFMHQIVHLLPRSIDEVFESGMVTDVQLLSWC